ncbi:4-hydroxythreonine-4-phosphate dehydrogenase PdxA [Tabrizicola sp.]|uniref:4-hydroxythreonine-4-phosphate dehydrogenase PdxA n=1 Tax=Tabrizicola sp. TaxID=2005166 RepID=UPI002734767F|nr:4-hydroxythreonine-4-phosphate dehydrogenase PdxA [Tabrizicola sp.]MDP3195771.1 4-hydroxythreonine-4-phosphate dehydrogenase PdxA [Tabrizicola sp.]
MSAPVLLTCGDPSGIGPEIAAKAWAAGERFVWIGDPRHLPLGTKWRAVAEGEAPGDGAMAVLRLDFAGLAAPGRPDPANAAGVVAAITRAVRLVQAGLGSAVCTAPINKKALKDGAGFAFPGHTEFLAHLAGVDRVVMMLACPGLRVVPATIHIPVSEVPAALTEALLEATIRITVAGLIRDFGIAQPRIAVAGLNPHAGEGGAMGWEEERMIRPLLARLKVEGLNVTGPWPADTMFHAGARNSYDAAVCAYHDQALIPIKTIDFAGGVNVTLGLPFVRTSPDHGTAYDIAGRNLADPSSLIAALAMAREMVATRGA